MNASGMSGRLIKGSAWISAARIIVNALAALSTIVLATYLSPADFGIVALGTTLLAIVSSVTELSLAQALVRHSAPVTSHFNTVWTLNAARGLILFILFAASGYPVAILYEEPRLTEIMVILGLSVFIGSLTNPRRIMLQRSLVFWQEFVLNVSQKLAGVVAAITIAAIYHSYWALVIGALVTQIVNVAVSYMAVPFRPSISFRHIRELFSFSGWLTAAQIINTLNWRFDYLLVGKMLGSSALGQYTVGSNLAMLPTRETIAPLTLTMFPAFSSIANDAKRLAAAYQRGQAFITAVAFPIGIGAALIADPLVRLMMGEKWIPAIFVIQALAPVFALQTLGQFAQPLGMALGQTRLLFARDLQLFFIRLAMIVTATLMYGLKGMVIARVLSGSLAIIMNLQLVKRFTLLSVREQLKVNGRAVLSVAVMASGVLLVVHSFPHSQEKSMLIADVAMRFFTGAFLYIGTMLTLWMIMKRPIGPETEIQQIWMHLRGRRSDRN